MTAFRAPCGGALVARFLLIERMGGEMFVAISSISCYGPTHLATDGDPARRPEQTTPARYAARGRNMKDFPNFSVGANPRQHERVQHRVEVLAEPRRFLPIVECTAVAGRNQIAETLFGLRLPDPEATSFTIGRLIIWSNDLMELAGDLGHNTQASRFLR